MIDWSSKSDARIINNRYLKVVFTHDKKEYVYYAEIDVKLISKNVTVKNDSGSKINFFPGLIPRIKAKTIGYESFLVSSNGPEGLKEEKMISLEKIFTN